MAKTKSSLDALEASFLKQLQTRKAELQAEISKIDAKLGALGKATPGRKPGRPPKTISRRGRHRGVKPLRTFVADALAKATGALTVKELQATVVKAGYPGGSKSLYSQVHKALKTVPGMVRAARGKYILKGAPEAAPKRQAKKGRKKAVKK